MKAVEALRAAGAEVVFDDGILPASFARTASRVATYAYMQDGTNRFLAAFGPAEYHSAADYLKAVGSPLFTSSIGTEDGFRSLGGSGSISACWTAIRTPSGFITRRGERCWRPISRRSIA